jgi:Flp pilus assembly pilin Flp
MKRNKSQTFLEYAVLIGVVAAALVAMRVYMVRVVQEKYRQSADVFGEGEQYQKGVTVVGE